MKQFKKGLALVSIVLLFGSCATISNLSTFDSGASLSSGNYNYVKTVSAERSSNLLFGVIGGSDHSQKAIDDLRSKANLKNNQALANVSVVKTIHYGIFFVTHTVKVTADVVYFTPESE